jgi:beta-glucanase (GH16 family)
MRLIKKTACLRLVVSVFLVMFPSAGFVLALTHEASAQDLRLVWSDDFQKPGPLDPTKWEFELGNANGWGNRELEDYTNRPENIFVDGNGAEVVARKEEYQGFHYTSAKFHSLASWQYGIVEVRAKLPDGRGMWPAIWLMPQYSLDGGWPDSGEIDMMEEVAFDPNVSHFTLHQSTGGPSNTIRIPTLTSQYHTYRLEWTPDHIAGYVDDHPYYRYDRGTQDWHGWPYDQPFYLIINDAVGGNWGGTDGVDDSAFPQTLSIASVRVYKRISHPHGGKAHLLPGTVEAADYDDGGEGFAYHSDQPISGSGKYRRDDIGISATGDPKHPYSLAGIRPDQWMNYTVHTDSAGTYDLTFYVASPYRDAKFRIEVDDTPAGHFRAPDTGGWSTWQGVTASGVKLSAGDHVVRVLSDWTDWSLSYFEGKLATEPNT